MLKTQQWRPAITIPSPLMASVWIAGVGLS